VTSSHSECSAGNWLPRNNFCIVRYRSECIYVLQINFIKKKKSFGKKRNKLECNQLKCSAKPPTLTSAYFE
jgi:hypothetical protein